MAAKKLVLIIAAKDFIGPKVAVNNIITGIPEQGIMAAVTDHLIIAGIAERHIVEGVKHDINMRFAR